MRQRAMEGKREGERAYKSEEKRGAWESKRERRRERSRERGEGEGGRGSE